MENEEQKTLGGSPARRAFFAVALAALLIIAYDAAEGGGKRGVPLYGAAAREQGTPASDPFLGIELAALSAYVYDEAHGEVLYEKAGEVQRPLASLAKIMTALTAARLAPEYATVTIEPAFIAVEGDSGLRLGERWRIGDLIQFMLVGSSNDSATAVAATAGAFGGEATDTDDYEGGMAVFVREMNREAGVRGLAQTFFLNGTGLDISVEVSGAYGSARDVVALFRAALTERPELFEATQYEEATLQTEEMGEHRALNTNDAIAEIPRLIASKTGYTELAGGNLVVALDAGLNHRIFIAVLGSTERERFKDVRALARAALHSVGNPPDYAK